jgi:hypothetical protein
VELPGLTPLVFAGDLRWEQARLRIVVEQEPPGSALLNMLRLPLSAAEAERLGGHLVDLAEALSETGRFWPLHPRILYPQPRGLAAAARGGALLDLPTGEFKKPAWEPTLDAPEVQRGQPRRAPAMVFSVAAVVAWMRLGFPPFGSRLEEELRLHMQPEPAEWGMAELDPALARAAEQRPSLNGLRQRLRAGQMREILRVPRWFCAAELGEAGPLPAWEQGRLRLLRRWEQAGAFLQLPGPRCLAELGDGPLAQLPDGRWIVVGNDGLSALHDPVTNRWTEPGAAGGPGAAVVTLAGGKVMSVGWGGVSVGVSPSRVVQLFDPATSSWSSLPPLTFARGSATATRLADGRVLVVGGAIGQTQAEIFDAETEAWRLVPGPPVPVEGHGAVLLPDGAVVVSGGWNGAGPEAGVHRFDPATETWSSLTALPEARGYHSMIVLPNGDLMVAGGVSTNAAPIRTTWTRAAAGGAWRAGPGVAVSAGGRRAVCLAVGGGVLEGRAGKRG